VTFYAGKNMEKDGWIAFDMGHLTEEGKVGKEEKPTGK